MPIKKSAIKRAKQSIVRTERNRALKKTFRLNIKEVVKNIKTDTKKVGEGVSAAYKALDKAAKNGAIHKNTAARKKSRLMKKINAETAVKPEKKETKTKDKGTK